MNRIYLEKALVPAQLRGSYAGSKFQVEVTTEVEIPATAGLWDGGSQQTYWVVVLETGKTATFPGQASAPGGARRNVRVPIVPGAAVVRKSIFRGKDMGLTFFVHPDNASALLPAPVDVSSVERVVLTATSSFKSSYGGRDRYQMAEHCSRCKTILRDLPFPSRADWDAAKASLIAKGMLLKSGAITPKGRNAAG